MTNDQLFQVLGLIGLPVCFVVLYAGVKFGGCDKPPAGPPPGRPCCPLIRKLVALGFGATFLILAATGLWPNLVLGEKLHEWSLMLHVGTGGAFMFFLLAAALLWADECRCEANRFSDGMKFTFLVMLALGVVTALTMIVSMLPIFSVDGLDVLREIHRYAAVVFVAVALLHVILAIKARRPNVQT